MNALLLTLATLIATFGTALTTILAPLAIAVLTIAGIAALFITLVYVSTVSAKLLCKGN